jgi:hypothetical protein
MRFQKAAMAIKFSLFRNKLSTATNRFRAVVQSAGAMSYEQVIDRIVKQNTTVTRADTLAVLDNFFAAIEDGLLLGYTINTPGGNYRLTIKGGFDGDRDSFTPGRNTVEVSISPGPRLRQAILQAEVQKQEDSVRQPRPKNYLDLKTGEYNNLVSPGAMGQITGYRLRFDPTDPEQGIFFVNGSATRVELTGKNGSTELMFMVPAGLTPGEYSLEVRSALNNGKLFTGVLLEPLTVA